MSKLLESYVLDQLKDELTIRPNQYGGLQGSGTNHFLIQCWDNILRALDTPETAVSLLSIDFSKAFNRMDHAACLTALANCGASTDSLAMIAAFLTGRKMKVKVNYSFSSPRAVKGGSPQGTRLGNFLPLLQST